MRGVLTFFGTGPIQYQPEEGQDPKISVSWGADAEGPSGAEEAWEAETEGQGERSQQQNFGNLVVFPGRYGQWERERRK